MESEAKMTTECPSCFRSFAVRVSQLGKRAKCTGCGEPFEIVPKVEIETAAALPSPPPTPAPRSTRGGRSSAGGGVWWRNPKWLAVPVAVGAIGLAVFTWQKTFNDDSDPRVARAKQMKANAEARQQAIAAAAASPANNRAAAASPPPPSPAAPPAAIPALAWSTDAAGRAVGSAVAAVQSKRTDVRLVLPPGRHADRSLPCVFVCPAGSNLLIGVPWGDDEQQDFYGLLERGLAVCFYSLDGTIKDYGTANDMQMALGMQAYLKTGCGLGNLRDAIDTALAGSPAVDPARLGSMGHSSAGTIAIAGAAADPRLVAVAAMAPAIDLPKRLAGVFGELPDFAAQQVRQASPSAIETLSADVFIYHANDDRNCPAADSQAFADKHGGKVTLRRVPTGGHGGAYTAGRGPSMDFLAAKLGGKPTPGAGRAAAAGDAAGGRRARG